MVAPARTSYSAAILSQLVVDCCSTRPDASVKKTIQTIFDELVPSALQLTSKKTQTRTRPPVQISAPVKPSLPTPAPNRSASAPSRPTVVGDLSTEIFCPSWQKLKPVVGRTTNRSRKRPAPDDGESSDEDISDATMFLSHARTAHDLNVWAARTVLTSNAVKSKLKRKLYNVDQPFFAPPLPPQILSNTPVQFNYSNTSRVWKRPKDLISIFDPNAPTQSKPDCAYSSASAPASPLGTAKGLSNFAPNKVNKLNSRQSSSANSNNKLKISLKVNKKAVKKQKTVPRFGKARTPPYPNEATTDDADDMERLQAEYKLAQLKLKYLRLKKELLSSST